MMPADGSPSIPADEYRLSWTRAPGPGGQNVNKLATACQLRFPVGTTSLLDEAGRERLRRLAGRRLTQDDELLIDAHRHRTREANRRDALERLARLVEAARQVPRVRKATRPTRAARERRIETKKHRQATKRLRGRVTPD
jgi:ribosome-associated protein